MDLAPFIQIAALGGIPAMVFVLLCAGSWLGLALSEGLRPRPDRRGLFRSGLVVLLMLAAVFGFGALRLSHRSEGARLTIALAGSDEFVREKTPWPKVVARYGEALAAKSVRADLTVLPEKLALVDEAGLTQVYADLGDLARRTGGAVVAGVEVRRADGTFANLALLVRRCTRFRGSRPAMFSAPGSMRRRSARPALGSRSARTCIFPPWRGPMAGRGRR
jgi:apolipoprotein N-acyltransferase